MRLLVEEIKMISDIKCLNDNKVILNDSYFTEHHNKKLNVQFFGKNNILFLEDGIDTNDVEIQFKGSNALVYLAKNCHHYNIHISVSEGGVVYLGRNAYMNPNVCVDIQAYEKQNVIIGNDTLFSLDIQICTSDAHKIYDFSGNRANLPGSVLIGDHVWVGQNSIILKGVVIGSGAIVGAHSVVSGGMRIQSNTVVAGNPARLVKQDVFFTKESAIWEDYQQTLYTDSKEYIYQYKENLVGLEEIDRLLKSKFSSIEKLDVIDRNIVWNRDKDRFCIK